jgi:hypothetical protein
MNKDTPIPSSVRLERGKIETVTLNSGGTARVKVRFLPARHLNEYLEIRERGNDAVLLEYVLERDVAYVAGRSDAEQVPANWEPVRGRMPKDLDADAAKSWSETAHMLAVAFIDDLDDESVERLIGVADWLNLFRAVSQAERQIVVGKALLPIKQRLAATMMEPIEKAMTSLTQSLVSQLSNAAAKTKP